MNNPDKPIINTSLSLGQSRKWLSYILRLTDLTVMLHGPPGIGKSAIVEQIARDEGYELIVCSLLLFDPTEMKGIPYVEGVSGAAQGLKRTIWAVPDRWPRPAVRYLGPEKVRTIHYHDNHNKAQKVTFRRKCQGSPWQEIEDPALYRELCSHRREFEFRKGILFLDEFNVAPSLVQCVTLKLVDSRRIETYELPREWRIVVAGNLGAEDGAYVSRTSSAVNNRFVHFFVEPNPKEWCEWARKNAVHNSIIAFVQAFPELFSQVPKRGDAAFPSPRMWFNLSKLLTAWEDEGREAGGALVGLIRECGPAFVGPAAAIQFAAFLESYAELDAEAAIVRGDFSRLDLARGNPDKLLAAVACCVGFLKACERLGEASSDHYRNLGLLLRQIPQEYQMAALQMLDDPMLDRLSDTDEGFYQDILGRAAQVLEPQSALLM